MARKKRKSSKRGGRRAKEAAGLPPSEPRAVSLESARAGPETTETAPSVTRASPPPSDEPVAIDLDADLDDAGLAPLSPGTVERLIAEALGAPGGAPPTELGDDDVPVIDLDGGEDAPVARPPVPAAETPLAADGVARSARAAAAPSRTSAPGPRGVLAPTRPPAAPPDASGPGTISSPEVRDRLLAEALAHAEHKDARYRVPYSDPTGPNRWKALLVVVLLALAGAAAAAPPRWIRPEPPASLGRAEELRGLRVALLLQADQVEAFRLRTQRLPTALDEVPGQLPGIRYVRSGNRVYQLVAYGADGSAVVYDSAAPTPPFRALTPPWQAERPEP